MGNSFWRLKQLPWLILLQNAGLTVAMATAVDVLLTLLLVNSGGLALLGPALLPLIAMVLSLGAAFAIGALAVMLMERCFRQVLLSTAVLWALVPCLALALLIKGLLPVPSVFIQLSYFTIVGMMVGIFVKGRRYWRY